jgi:hypothetical protein
MVEARRGSNGIAPDRTGLAGTEANGNGSSGQGDDWSVGEPQEWRGKQWNRPALTGWEWQVGIGCAGMERIGRDSKGWPGVHWRGRMGLD